MCAKVVKRKINKIVLDFVLKYAIINLTDISNDNHVELALAA
jgi:hypothetical protein